MPRRSGGTFDYPVKRDRLEEVNRELENPAIWSKPEQAQALGRERAQLTNIVRTLDELSRGLAEAGEMLGLAVEEQDAETAAAVGADLERMEERVERLEFQRMFSGEMDSRPCFLDIQAGSGGTEAQDWAEMLLRMYLRWAERRGWQTDLVEVSYGDVAGIKSATVHIVGDYAYGWCRTETGVHRLVRKSPFDSGNRRHTSFAAVFASLGSAPRLRLLFLLYHDPDLTVGELARTLGISISGVSAHLRRLREAKLVSCRRDGQTICCTLASGGV